MKKGLKIFLIVLAVILILLIIAGSVAFAFIKNKLDKINYEEIDTANLSINENLINDINSVEGVDVVRKVNYEQIFMFIYSIRSGTVAEKREDQIPEDIKHKRFDRLKELYEARVDENNEKYIGTEQKVLIEGFSKNNEKMYTARTDTNKVVVFKPTENEKIGDIVKVKILSAHKWYLEAEIIDERG